MIIYELAHGEIKEGEKIIRVGQTIGFFAHAESIYDFLTMDGKEEKKYELAFFGEEYKGRDSFCKDVKTFCKVDLTGKNYAVRNLRRQMMNPMRGHCMGC